MKQTLASKASSRKVKVSKNKNEWHYFKSNSELLLLSLPGFLYKLIFAYLPMLGVVIAFKKYRYDLGILGSEWVGLENFRFFFISDYAWRVTRNTVLYELGYTLIGTISALTLAILLNELTRRWIKVHQTILFLPYFLSWVVISYVSLAFLDMNNGFLNRMLEYFGLNTVDWYFQAWPWPYVLNVVAFWKRIGFATLIYYAGVIGINQEYYEAAKIDGANRFQMATRITIPMLAPLVIILLILAIGGMFNGDFGLHYFVPNNQGMTYPTTDIIDTFTFRALLNIGDIGMSAAVGLYQSIVGLILVVGANFVVKKINDENSLW